MRTLSLKTALRTILLAGLVAAASVRPAAAAWSASFSFFHDTLSPHGQWVATASYGEVWIPRTSASWAPYVNGQWVYTAYGWTWMAADAWGEVPYRYGTWVWMTPYGWVWIPGYVWAPAWVTWAYTDDYVGWAPVPPSFAVTASGYFGRPIVVSQTHYVFVPARRFVGTPISGVRVIASRNAAILSHSRRVTAYDVSSGGVVRNVGPARARIERAAGRRIEHQTFRPTRATLAPTRFERAGFAKASRAVASPQWTRPDEGKAPSKASASQAVSRPSSKKAAAIAPAGRAQPPSAKAHSVRSSPSMKAKTVRSSSSVKPKAVRSSRNAKTSPSSLDRAKPSTKIKVEKAPRPNRERPAAARAPKASKAKVEGSQKTTRKEPARRPDRDNSNRGGSR